MFIKCEGLYKNLLQGEQMMEEINLFLARQPVLNKHDNLYGYELLYRNSEQNYFTDIEPEKATVSLLINTFLSFGIDKVSDGNRVFINFSKKLIEDVDFIRMLDARQVVIEVLETVEITPSIIRRLRELRKQGFMIALDDFTIDFSKVAEYKPLFQTVDILKIDFLETSELEQNQFVALKKYFPHLILLAEKVETKAQRDRAEEIGFELFQGYFYTKPEILKGIDISPNFALHSTILNLLYSESPNLNKAAEIIMKDMSLTYKLLRYINTTATNLHNKVSSIKQALILLGVNEIRNWIKILMFQELGVGEERGSIKALVERSLVRAKLCEILAEKKGRNNTEEFFLAGMFSNIHIIMVRKKEEILPLLHLSDKVTNTLIGEKTDMTLYLELATAVENVNLNLIKAYAIQLGFSEEKLMKYLQNAYRWAGLLGT